MCTTPRRALQFIINRVKKNSRWALGVFLLLLVVLIWVGSSNLMQFIFVDSNYDHPFFLTYFSTSLFSLYLAGFALFPSWRSIDARARAAAEATKVPPSDGIDHIEHKPLKSQADPDDESSEAPVVLDGEDDIQTPTPEEKTPPLPVTEVMKLSITFCIVWFIANWSYNASLSMTSVTSNTIISTTSSFFTLGFTHLCGVERFTLKRLAAVVVTFAGIVLVSVADSESGGRETLWGDALALLGASFYGVYCSLLKYKIKDENQVNMPMFFGFVGFFNMILLWPVMIILHFAGIEKFEIPPLNVIWMLTLNGLIGTVLSDLIWSLSIFLTSALLGTLGLSLTVPLALAVDLFRGKKRLNAAYACGGLLALAGFLVANVDINLGLEDKLKSCCRQKCGCKCCGPDTELEESGDDIRNSSYSNDVISVQSAENDTLDTNGDVVVPDVTTPLNSAK